ncbi:MAG: hypoxanthine phosphoribosyltransferase [Candidatus Margulisiibacteriota bacterium]|nr:hypoxanthine phosphoribosyltransferase [Candidatus Margulisiibacteriota bacterium]
MAQKNRPAKTLISSSKIRKRVRELGCQISRDYKGKKLVLVGILKGSVIFLADLLREIDLPVELDFIQVSSYGTSKTSSGAIKIKKDIDLPIAGKHVLIIEDIVDYGYTMDYLFKFIKSKKARSVRVCTLLNKTSRREVDVSIAYQGFEVPDKFIVGYGLDFAEKMRNLPSIKSIG